MSWPLASKPKVRIACRVLPYLEPSTWPEPTPDLEASLLESTSDSPLRGALEKRSDMAFLAEIQSELRSTLPASSTADATLAVCSTPTVQVRRTDGAELRILQSILLASDETRSEFPIALTIELTGREGKPRTMAVDRVEVTLLDVENDEDLLGLVGRVEEWRRDFPIPGDAGMPPPDLPRWAFAGNPTHGLLHVPHHWQDLILRAGQAHGSNPTFAPDLDTWKSKSAGASDFVVAPNSASWVPGVAGDDLDVYYFGAHGMAFEEGMTEIRRELLRRAGLEALPARDRELAENEVVYHRKVGTGRRFDHFDAGTAEPCMHGARGFKSFKSADKASKGMARRYSNYDPRMLMHCGKYPNCGVYAVDASR